MDVINRGFLLVGWAGILLCPSTAWAENGFQLDVSGGGSYERNPFLLPGDDTESVAAFIEIAPAYRSIDKVTTVNIDATLRAEEYAHRFDRNLSARLGIDVSRRLSPNTTLRGRLAGRTSRTSALDFFPATGASTPATAPPITLPDVTFLGSSTRTSELQAGLGLDVNVSERDQLSADLAASITYFSGPSQSDFRYGSATINYSRKVAEQTSMWLSMRVGVFDYLQRAADDGITFTPTVGIKTNLGARVTFAANAGVSVSRVKRIDGSNFSNVVPSLHVELCYRTEFGSTCANATRDSQPTGLRGLSTVTNFGGSITRRLNPKDEFSVYANYTLTSSRPETVTATDAGDLLSVSGSFYHNFHRKFAIFVNPSYTYLSRSATARRSNPGVRIGLRYRFGGFE